MPNCAEMTLIRSVTMLSRTILSATISTALGVFALADQEAQAASAKRQDGYGSVTAHSRYGNPSRTARVRPGRFGREVELGNNTWVHCEAGDCAYTLRRQKIDFWETIREEGRSGGRH
jgi:hypothetical protein